MHPDSPAHERSTASQTGKDGSSALDHETNHVENITGSQDRKTNDDSAELTEAERARRNEQDARVNTIAKQAKEANQGSKQPGDHLNKDG